MVREMVNPNEVDILCCAGHEAAHHAGNVNFKQMVAEHFDEYSNASSKTTKMRASRAILRKIIGLGARFLKKEDTHRPHYWYVADIKVGKDKISHVLREMKRERNRVRENSSSILRRTTVCDDASKLGRQQQQAMTARAAVYQMDAASIMSRSEPARHPEQRDASPPQPPILCRTGQTTRIASAPTRASSGHHDMKIAGDMQASTLHMQRDAAWQPPTVCRTGRTTKTANAPTRANTRSSGHHDMQIADDTQASASLHVQQADTLSQQRIPKKNEKNSSLSADHLMKFFMHSFLDDEDINVFAGNHQQQQNGNDGDDRNGNPSDDIGSMHCGSDDSRRHVLLTDSFNEVVEDSSPSSKSESTREDGAIN